MTLLFAAIVPLFIACTGSEDNPVTPDNGNDNSEGAVTVSGIIDVPSVDATSYLAGCKVISMSGEANLNGTNFTISSNANDYVQTYVLIDSDENVYLAARSIYKKGGA